jgi:uncharacterized LabA/DUF88 family protein
LSKNVAIFIDVANLYYSARGQDVDVDYVALLKAATKGRDLIRAYAYSGLDPENENQRKFIDFLTKNGYKVVHKDIRKFGDGRVKANLDIELVVDLFRLQHRMDIAVIVSGDGDFAPAIRALQDVGVRCEVISFRPNTSSDLLAVADEFTDIMKIASIGREKTAKGMGAPPMPAKEVEPEFAFRDASPAVAAAALAAIRGGDAPRARGGRGRGTTTRRRTAEPADEKVETAAASAATTVVDTHDSNGSENGEHHRRRRRGGRGRGRRGHGTGETAAPAATGEDAGWQEFDDISQLGDLEEDRAYTFEEADSATLAELGLLDEAPTAPPAEPAETAAAPRRSRTRKAPASDAAASDAPADDKPKRGRPRKTASVAAEPDEAAAEASAAAKPKRGRPRKAAADASAEASAPDAKPRRTRAAKPKAAEEPIEAPADGSASDGDAEPQGIWGRFRSARGGR